MKILMVDDFREFHDMLRQLLKNQVTVISAMTIEEAMERFMTHPDIAIIVMDACVPGGTPTTPSLVRWIRQKGFIGPMVAISSEEDFRHLLVDAGCDHQCKKMDLPEKILKILGIVM